MRLGSLLEYLKAQTHGFDILVLLTRSFDKIDVLENWGEYFKLRVPKEDKSIGHLFGEIDRKKKKFGIQYYSIT